MASNDNTDVQMENMTLIQLKDELRRKMKTTDVKADLIRRLQTAIIYEKEKDNNVSDDDETTEQTTDRRMYSIINKKLTC